MRPSSTVHRRWFVNRTNPEYIRYLAKTASISPVLAQILINRGLKTPEEIKSFVNPDLSQLSDPFEMPGMKMAVERITAARKKGERVFVHGDYDADGLTATAIMMHALMMLGIDCRYFIPHRMEHGYGFKVSSVRKAKEVGASLIITVDCGITSLEAAALCGREDIDLIITDHHEPLRNTKKIASAAYNKQAINLSDAMLSSDDSLIVPDAVTVINPKISRKESPVFHLSGAGIAFKLVQALAITHGEKIALYDFLDLVALGTMADVVPLTGENRILVKEGLKMLGNGSRQGIKALKTIAGIDGKALKPSLLLFTVIPRINAAGRVSDSQDVIKLLLSDSEDEAFTMGSWLETLNAERQRIEEEVFQKALLQLNDKGTKSVIVLSDEGWNKGVVGIVASRIAEIYYRPTFIFSLDGNTARGSARSIPSFDIYKALTGCKDCLAGFGGHKQAAGLELETRNISLFEAQINRIAEETMRGQDCVPTLDIDADVELSDITFDLAREFDMLEPFGYGNAEPLIGSKGLEVLYPKIVKDNHLKMKLRQKGQALDAIGFNMAALFEKLATATKLDAVYTLAINEWKGSKCLQLNLKALRPSQE
jgi:single-stranded-DNA-specific exonuclease